MTTPTPTPEAPALDDLDSDADLYAGELVEPEHDVDLSALELGEDVE